MVPPGVDLTVVLYACLRIGAVVVVADAGLGTRGLSRAVKGATPDFLIGIDKALAAASVLGWPGRRISVRELPAARRRLLGVETSLAALTRRTDSASDEPPSNAPDPAAAPDPDAPAAVLFTSGSTGPPKACSTPTGSWWPCGIPWRPRWASVGAHAWWRPSRRLPSWVRHWEPFR